MSSNKRDIGHEILQGIREIKQGRYGRVVDVPSVAATRATMGLSQSEFARLLGVSVRTLQEWEQGRRVPSGPARTLLMVADRNPKVLLDVARLYTHQSGAAAEGDDADTRQGSLHRLLIEAISGGLAPPRSPQMIILFGSLAGNNARADSDIDLAVDAGHRLTVTEKVALVSAISKVTGRTVDLVDLNAVGEPLLGQILAHGKRILGSDECYARLISRHLADEADFLPYRNRILAERRRAWIGL